MIKYVAVEYLSKVEIGEVESETSKYVTLKNGRREKKLTESTKICDSFEEAKAWLIEKSEREILAHLISAHKEAEKLERIRSLDKPSGNWRL